MLFEIVDLKHVDWFVYHQQCDTMTGFVKKMWFWVMFGTFMVFRSVFIDLFGEFEGVSYVIAGFALPCCFTVLLM